MVIFFQNTLNKTPTKVTCKGKQCISGCKSPTRGWIKVGESKLWSAKHDEKLIRLCEVYNEMARENLNSTQCIGNANSLTISRGKCRYDLFHTKMNFSHSKYGFWRNHPNSVNDFFSTVINMMVNINQRLIQVNVMWPDYVFIGL